jgi:hypothetical protein
MTIHNFDFNDIGTPRKLTDMRLDPKSGEGLERRPAISPLPIGKEALPKNDIYYERQNVNIAEDVREILPQGYRTMDRGIKNYFSGILVPTKDGLKMTGVRISGGDKAYLIWAQDLKMGRVTLPVMAIKRESDQFNEQKFSPPHFHYMSRRFLDSEGSKVALAYRPRPAILKYTLSVWAEHKRDLEYILYQISTRFNPIAEFMVEDEHLRGSVVLKYNGMTVAVDDDIPADKFAQKRYDIALEMEGWLPLPEKHVPTILGRVTTLKDQTFAVDVGDVLDVVHGKDVLNDIQIRRQDVE